MDLQNVFPLAESKNGLSIGVKLGLVAMFGLLGVVLTSMLIICFFKRRSSWRKGDKIKEKNIVTLVEFCYQKKRALVYRFMPNGSLDKYIGNKGSQNKSYCQLEWKTLYQIAIRIARGLEYLH
ncbi:PREDICTED: uncharacterized protein LOC109151145 [Ipomoea nil]|uniref:uncharacterized protein LOC109151145 n=1 Tax=Ipomoea nil TaxID=35883 RepID=UPI0009016A7A|nr:PREDICTED: uncharacterized protein LOC109151145 [Ipomoea nil]